MKLKKIKFTTLLKPSLLFIACVSFAMILIKNPTLSAEGVRKGLELSAQTMIPSLFPFLVLSSFMTESGLVSFFGEKTDKFFKHFAGLSGSAGSVVLFSLFSGFPVGCSMAARLYEQKKITENEAKRIALSSVNAGPAFVIGSIGTMMLSSPKAGAIIFISLSLSSILISFFTRFILADKEEITLPKDGFQSISEALVSSVYIAAKSMFMISAWLIFFSCIANIISSKVQDERFLAFIKSVLEVSIGCEEMSSLKNPAILAAVLGWSGLSVHCQVFPYILKIGLKSKYFFCSRILHAMLSSVICGGLIKIFPCEISVFSNSSQIITQTFAASAPAAAGLMLMCAIFILDLDRHEKV